MKDFMKPNKQAVYTFIKIYNHYNNIGILSNYLKIGII